MESVLRGLVTVFGVATLALYAWSAAGHFKSSKLPRGSLAISAIVLATAVLYAWLLWRSPDPPLLALGLGVIAQAISVEVFFSAIGVSRNGQLPLAFDPSGPRGLIVSGPYRHLRHPFYASYMLFWSGWGLATWSVWALPSLALLAGIYVAAGLGEERSFAASPMATAYAEYKHRSGFLWPRWR